MNDAERRLTEDRSARNAARGLFDTRLGQVKADLAARSVPARIKARATDEAAKAVEQGVAIARESKGIIAGTAAALALWFFREPLLNWGKRLVTGGKDAVQTDDDNGSEEAEEFPQSE